MMITPDARETLVIGFGNEWLGDDGLGPRVARRIAAYELPNVRVQTVHQLTPELAEAISAVEQVFFVDSCKAVQPTPVFVAPITDEGAESLEAHCVDPRAILALARLLYGRVPRAWLVTIEGKQFEPGESLSNSAARHADEAVQRITAMLV
jgi:hydrogenase maturation protease